ncbi:MAG TPA: hypothetical protein VJ306_04475 [Pyrinomonadaceae bacterium]|jgi:hypothetical protein|nr:hypothetical protein [Pyrinomonadaceae bacterium]
MQTLKLSRLAQLSAVIFITVITALAQGTTQPSPSPTPTDAAQPGSTPLQPILPKKPRVIAMMGNLELDDIVEVNVENLEQWAQANDPSKLVPYINGRAITGNYPEELHLERGRLIYHLEVTPENKRVWIDLLGAPNSLRKQASLSVGLENGSAFDSKHDRSNPVTMTVISPVYGLIALFVIVITLALLIWLVRKTNIIREPGPPPVTGKRRPYNLGRAQMAFWFFLIYSSYMSIWLITDALDTITPSLLALMGISAGTALGEALIDNGKDTARTNQLQDLTAERQAVEQSITQSETDLDSTNTAPATLADQSNRDALNRMLTDSRTRLGQIDQQLRTLNAQQITPASAGFLRDILSDGSGYSFHRFQIFAWTIVLGIIFLSSVYNNLTMPEFSPTLLGLMGLSAGTYIGFKFPEQK